MQNDGLPKVCYSYQNHTIDGDRWQHFVPRAGDIVVATSYRSGTTWMLGIVHQLLFLGQPKPVNHEYWLESRRQPLDQMLATLDAQAHPRLLKTHLPLDGLPYHPQVKYIVVGRDARDVFMSLWNQYSHYTPRLYALFNDAPGRVGDPLPLCPQNIHECWHNWMTRGWFPWEREGYPFWGNLRHTQTWWDYRSLENILFVHFNDLLQDLAGEIGRVADFLGITVAEAELATLCQAVSLNTMRQEGERLYPGLEEVMQGGVQTFYFKGTNGRWKEILSAAEVALYHEAVQRVLTLECAAWLQHGRAALK